MLHLGKGDCFICNSCDWKSSDVISLAFNAVKFTPLTAGNVAGNLPFGIVLHQDYVRQVMLVMH